MKGETKPTMLFSSAADYIAAKLSRNKTLANTIKKTKTKYK
jgi:hypothetical protein